MPVDSKHKQYTERKPQWERTRDADAGSDAVKAKTTKYLPKLSGANHDYTAYLRRALWYGAFGRTVQGFIGSVFRNPPQVVVPDAVEEEMKTITADDVSFNLLASRVFNELMVVGRYGLLVDAAQAENGAEAPQNQTPWMAGYKAEDIWNWHVAMANGESVADLIVLHETVEEPRGGDTFEMEDVDQLRVLQLIGGVYSQQLYRKKKGGAGTQVSSSNWEPFGELMVPKMRGVPLDFIPFFPFDTVDNSFPARKPPLLELADMNYSHYNTSADLEHGQHFTALPTPYATGLDPGETLEIGSSTAWILKDKDSKVGMLEFTGDGLGTLERSLEKKEKLMAALGARLLEEQKRQAEAADTVRLRQSGEQSVLASIANLESDGLQSALRLWVEWAGQSPDDVTVELNTDFFAAPMTPEGVVKLVEGWQRGAYSYETMYWNLERGERTRPGVEAETEKALVAAQAPRTL
jgi:hypothetical protein